MNKKILATLITILILAVLALIFLMPNEPDDVVNGFYDDWISYEGNPIVDKIYREDERVTAKFIDETDVLISSFEQGGFDPVLCAQDIPSAFSTNISKSGRGEASVIVLMNYDSNAVRSEVSLLSESGEWKIDEIKCIGRDGDENEDNSFKQEGNIVRENGGWFLVYEEPGAPALRKKLQFNNDSNCLDGGIRTVCLSGILEVGARVRVVGEIEDDEVVVSTLNVIRIENLLGDVIGVDRESNTVQILIGGGTEAINAHIGNAEIVSDEDLEAKDIGLGDRLKVRGRFNDNIFVADSVEVIFSAGTAEDENNNTREE